MKMTTLPGAALCLLVAGCSSQPYPSLPPELLVQQEVAPDGLPAAAHALPQNLIPQSVEPAAGDAGVSAEEAAIAMANPNVSDAAKREAMLPPVSQRVAVPPPDPAALPAADKRQLDIRLESQRFNYFEDGRLVWTGPISSGTEEHPTPKGDFRVLSKDIDKRSGSYTNFFDQPTPMPYALQFSGPYYVHEGYLPGKPASHGCVRLRYEDARFVYARIRVGDRLVVAD